jgi:hypothetical protein
MAGRRDERFHTELRVRLEGGFGIARNVSASGIFFVTDVALQAGQPVSFTLEFEDFPSGPIAVDCIAQVVRVEEQGTTRGVGVAISSFEFHRIPSHGKAPFEG